MRAGAGGLAANHGCAGQVTSQAEMASTALETLTHVFTEEPMVGLTFDDGPDPVNTLDPQIGTPKRVAAYQPPGTLHRGERGNVRCTALARPADRCEVLGGARFLAGGPPRAAARGRLRRHPCRRSGAFVACSRSISPNHRPRCHRVLRRVSARFACSMNRKSRATRRRWQRHTILGFPRRSSAERRQTAPRSRRSLRDLIRWGWPLI